MHFIARRCTLLHDFQLASKVWNILLRLSDLFDFVLEAGVPLRYGSSLALRASATSVNPLTPFKILCYVKNLSSLTHARHAMAPIQRHPNKESKVKQLLGNILTSNTLYI